MATSETSEKVWYEASCHCGAVQYKAKVADIEKHQTVSCNCTVCTKNGYLNVYPLREDIVFHQGEDHMKDYHFVGGWKSHKFCPTCGSSLMIDFHNRMREYFGADVLALNVRMFKDVDIRKLDLRHFDGLNLL